MTKGKSRFRADSGVLGRYEKDYGQAYVRACVLLNCLAWYDVHILWLYLLVRMVHPYSIYSAG